jgi:glycine cleavage system aminomethyltransferase T
MISLAVIDRQYGTEGKDVVVLWGSPGRSQKEIRAKVARYPYYDEEYRNETFDTERIPRPKQDPLRK